MSEENETETVPAEVEAEFDEALEKEAQEWEAAHLEAYREAVAETGNESRAEQWQDGFAAGFDAANTRFEAKDAQGHEHVASGEKGGQFTGSGQGGKGAPESPEGKNSREQNGDEVHSDGFLEIAIQPASPSDLKKSEINLWHGTSYDLAKRISQSGKLRGGQRGNNASASVRHASQYPEDTGAQVLIVVSAKVNELSVDTNDQVGETVEEGLFPSNMSESSSTLGENSIVAMFDLEDCRNPDAAIAALNKGDWKAAKAAGLKEFYPEREDDEEE